MTNQELIQFLKEAANILEKYDSIEPDKEMIMEWEDYKKLMPKKDAAFQPRTQVDVKCPKCGKKIWRRNDITLTSYPEQYQYECDCGWIGYAFV